MATNTTLGQLRQKAGYTQKFVAAEIDEKAGNYQRYETGTRKIPPAVKQKLADFYKIPLEDFEQLLITGLEPEETQALPTVLLKKQPLLLSIEYLTTDMIIGFLKLVIKWLEKRK